MVARWALLAAMVGTVACRQSKDGDTGAPASDDQQPCEGTAPRIHELVVRDGGLVEHDGDLVPSLLFVFDGRDDDGDLYRYTVDIWYDQQIDGAVDRGDNNYIGLDPVELGGTPCQVDRMSASVRIAILGDATLALDTNYEWAVMLTDGNGIASFPTIVVGRTPSAGEDDGR